MSDTVKLIIEIDECLYERIKECEPNGNASVAIALHSIANGTPLANDSERAEAQAYFYGKAYGWEQGRKALIDDLTTEIADISTCADYTAYKVITRVLNILDSISRKDGE